MKARRILDYRGEVRFRFEVRSSEEIKKLTRMISISEQTKPGSKIVYAYANKTQFEKFITLNYQLEIIEAPPTIAGSTSMYHPFSEKQKSWDAYPTYQAYIDQMYFYESSYPLICTIYRAGKSVLNRELLFARITNPNSSNLLKPRVMLTSTMHGDETAGYVVLLRMIDYLLSGYGSGTKASQLLDNYEIWVNPLANPDGTYAGGDNTLAGATRGNANFIDLNRNFPDLLYGDHPDSQPWQPETQAMMHLADSLHFVVSINIHGGAEVVNYPWDTKEERHADDSWWQYIAKNYADTVFAHCTPGYFTGISITGYTNGSDWYIINGGRQDYMNFFKHCREFTLEISDIMTPTGSDLPEIWEANYRSIINFIKESANGVNGVVTDSLTGNPVSASVNIPGHDSDNSNVFSELPTGNYFRPVSAGQYTFQFSANGYLTSDADIFIQDASSITRNISLQHANSGTGNQDIHDYFTISPNPATNRVLIKYDKSGSDDIEINLTSIQGISLIKGKAKHTYNLFVGDLNPGIYFLNMKSGLTSYSKKVIITK